MNYKVGDKVKIKEGLEPGEYYKGDFFSLGMKELKGKKAIIVETIGNRYSLDIDICRGNWNDAMLESAEDKPKFKVGDKVRIIKSVGGSDKEYIGTTHIINEVFEKIFHKMGDWASTGYNLNNAEEYIWNENDLELVRTKEAIEQDKIAKILDKGILKVGNIQSGVIEAAKIDIVEKYKELVSLLYGELTGSSQNEVEHYLEKLRPDLYKLLK